ncbi:uncharacterized protein LOC129753702 [Uranotaenia lowii]|uniref:uncharacterized protein LOC129753702 n=1 Tax=Uranotaenia lowii TaxID=190385 RepID=UPI00247A0134|nr:uncharacterized protein LOC129753702 [Uranotaenia lowii]
MVLMNGGESIPIPSWLSDEYLLSVVRSFRNDPTITLCHGCKLRYVSDPGIFRAVMHYRSQKYALEQASNLVLILGSDEGEEVEDRAFAAQVQKYGKILPAIAKMLHDVGEEFTHPSLVLSTYKPHPVIILEEPGIRGWTPSWETFESYEDVLSTLKRVAQFHAASYSIHRTTISLANFGEAAPPADHQELYGSFRGEFSYFCNSAPEWIWNETLESKLRMLNKRSTDRLAEVYKPSRTALGFNVLNFADIELRTVARKMHSTDLGADFQNCFWGSPAIDLFCLLNVTISRSLKRSHRNQLIQQYHYFFLETLTKLGYLGITPSLIDLHVELLRKGFLDLLLEVGYEPLMNACEINKTTLQELQSGSTPRESTKDESKQEYFRQHLKTLLYKGLLDVIPSGEIQRRVMEQNSIFPREISIYRDILPKVHGLLQSIGYSTLISPRCTFTTDDPKTMLVFEDLRQAGYQMVDRRKGLDLEQTRLVLSKLAKLHACSAVIYREDPTTMAAMMEGPISTNPNRQDFLVFYKMCARMIVRLVESWKDPQFDEILLKLRNLPARAIEKGCQVYTRDESSFNVLTHDDVWTSNLMFKYRDGSLDDVLLFDYQLAYFGSPGVDLNYFLEGSVRNDVLFEFRLNFIREYYDELVETLQELNYYGKFPSLQDIHVEITRTGYHCVNAVFCLLPLAMMEDSENAAMDVFLRDNEAGESFRWQIFTNPRLEPILKKDLVRFHLLGYFD